MKHPQHSPADVKGAEPPQKIEVALSLLVEVFVVLFPVQFIVDEHPQIFVEFNMSTICPRMETEVTGVLVLLRSTTSFGHCYVVTHILS